MTGEEIRALEAKRYGWLVAWAQTSTSQWDDPERTPTVEALRRGTLA